ncbi:hypothetical protein JRI60_19750 [Archangium violaceum]|uniref:hypothetical protein n=1 Tax=Archangium violaceum TaxID=83451 RepID=UPI00194E8688|nr:hypothetical protein [Archangium violaceum]QRO03088.1 hypothetical protein JRI60_19750 [Archangium violaceum]
MYRPSLRHAVLTSLLMLSGACKEDDPGTLTPVPDAGTRAPDAGEPDSGTPDAGEPDSGTPDAGSGFTASGALTPATGKQVPSSAKVMVFWSVSSTSPDYIYKFGGGTSSGASFTLPMPTQPPLDALNSGELGVGLIALLPADYTLADGKLSEEALEGISTNGLGGAAQYAIIYKATPTVTYWSWANSFPLGYSCGKGVKARPEESHDTFEPVSCESIGITVDDFGNIEFVNWT